VDTRVCIKCEIEYPLIDNYFGLAHGSTTRRLTVCRECRKEYDRQYRINKKQEEQEISGDEMYTIKEEPLESKKHRLLKAFNQIHLQAFGEQMSENIYWCKEDDCVQITDNQCGKCNKTMEKIGFVDYNESGEK
jgi:hypothetical protein